MRLEFRLLGPLEVRSDGQVIALTSAKQRVLLAALLVEANRVVPAGRLISRLWDDESPASARATLQSHVMRLRRTLGAAGAALVNHADGYLIEVAPDCLDVERFESLVRQANGVGPARAAELLRQALAEWHGDPLSDIPSAHLRGEVVPGWQERRLAAVELRIDRELRLGRHVDVLAELADLTGRYPLRERFWAHRMRALHRAGRPAEALRCYDTVRDLLAGELGVDPGAELRDLHQVVLGGEAAVAAQVRQRRNDLPGDIPDFVGRADEFDRLCADGVPVTVISGMAGVGKTAMAVHAAHRLADRYPDGQLFLDLRGHTEDAEPVEPAVALATLLRALDVPPDRIPAGAAERSAFWLAELADRKVLVVLDNASSTDQIRPLLPSSSTCLVLITSRHRLTDLDTLSLDVLPESDALTLLASVVGVDRAHADPDASSDVLRLCGHLPLAIRIAAGRLRTRPSWPVRMLADRLHEEALRSGELAVGDRSVTAALTLSHRRLSAAQQRLFALLGQHPGESFDGYQAATLGGTGLAEAEDRLRELADVHLLQEPVPGRYRCHDLVRRYARTRTSVSEDARREAIGRLLDHYRYQARRAACYLDPYRRHSIAELGTPPGPVPDIADADDAIRWCETELTNLMAAIDYAAGDGRRTHAWQLAAALPWFFKRCGHTEEWIASLRTGALAATDANDRANLLRELGLAHFTAGNANAAIDCATEALTLYRQTDDLCGEAAALNNIGNVHLRLDQITKAVGYYRRALAVRRHAGDVRGAGITLNNLCYAHEKLGAFEESLACGAAALDCYRRTDDRGGEATARNNIALLYLRVAHDPTTALGYAHQALALHRSVRDRRNEACVLDTIGMIHRELGDNETALDYFHRALALAHELGCLVESEIRANIMAATLASAGR